ncbi:MAG TPA: hypothetical protein VHQ23_18935, partial [Ilumatobacteraceae bacterium]|nr:hypothetical protein [Ilumatobacteraceae bacterium]
CALGAAASAGPARAPWTFDDAYVSVGANDAGFELRMDGVRVGWTWDPGSGKYLRQQDRRAHVAADGTLFADAAGAPIPLTSGTTFVELVRA